MSDFKSNSKESNQESVVICKNDGRVKEWCAATDDINIEYDESNVPKFIMAPSKESEKIAIDLFNSFIEYLKLYASAADDGHRRKLVEAMRVFGEAQRNVGPTKTFTELTAAPELWKDRVWKKDRRANDRRQADRRGAQAEPLKETPPEFIRRVYAEQIEQGMTQADLKRMDLSLYQALHKYAQQHKAEGVKASDVLPPQKGGKSLEARMKRVAPRAISPKANLSEEELEAHRLYNALRMSRKNATKIG